MTPHDLGFFAVVVCISAVMGALLAILCRGRARLIAVCGIVASLGFFATLEWKFGSPEEWSWKYPITSLAYLFEPFLILVAAPALGAALLVGRWMVRRRSSNPSLQPTAGRRDSQI
jgi:hypothetical protein